MKTIEDLVNVTHKYLYSRRHRWPKTDISWKGSRRLLKRLRPYETVDMLQVAINGIHFLTPVWKKWLRYFLLHRHHSAWNSRLPFYHRKCCLCEEIVPRGDGYNDIYGTFVCSYPCLRTIREYNAHSVIK